MPDEVEMADTGATRDGSQEGIITPTCFNGQIYKQCKLCKKTCDEPNPVCTKDCRSGCDCPAEAPIWQNGMCTSQATCPRPGPIKEECSNGQIYKDCKLCDRTCNEPNPVCNKMCKPGCSCPPEAPIWQNGECTTESMCPTPAPTRCSGGARWTDCGSACISTCDQMEVRCTMQCVQRCECSGRTPLWHNNSCISESRCPDKRGMEFFQFDNPATYSDAQKTCERYGGNLACPRTQEFQDQLMRFVK